MPKGALLHVHLDATVNPEILLKLALQYPVFHVRVHEALSISNLSTNLPEFRALPDHLSELSSLTEASYPLGSWVPLHKARDSFVFGGKEGFDKWVIGALTINPAEAYGTHNTVKKASLSTLGFISFLTISKQIWAKFASTFITSSVCSYSFPSLFQLAH
jgi:adenosine deaminase CECR1